VVINLPKVKTHCMMLLTLGVKNLFGAVVGPRKSQWHMHAGADRIMFADLLLDICRTIKPALTIIDGVWGMQGRGPNNGTPCHLGFLGASCDPLAMDLALTPLLGVHPANFPLYNAAFRRGLVRSGDSDTQMVGDDPKGFIPKKFQLPVLESAMPVPGVVSGLVRRHLTSRPVQNPDLCRDCGKCAEVCPPGCLRFVAARKAVIDHLTCIRCYCCQEVCPANAIHFKTGALVSIVERLRAIMPQ
jgi:NAD-dependent dihydropyrimidine dehydrogenase PreA subunit